ncbi:hypothetical protein [Mesorhizobium sp. WSM3879]|uniref:hypothetical protein n=1 Tax=Mesorhizobium sp. WSM3879 TaxID=2029406 RepID=UPI00117C41ED|nr:hypothetical protein [Mesorhizobium sp. WSM3879]
MTTLTRRAALGAIASLPAIGGATAASSPLPAPTAEAPDERAVRLANELSEAMNGFMTTAGGTPNWVAHVKPSTCRDPISFSQDARESRPERIRRHFYALKALLEEETKCPWMMVLATEPEGSTSRILSIHKGGLHDPCGIIGPAIERGARWSHDPARLIAG